MKDMIAAIRCFHQKHGFAYTGGEDMFYRMNLIMEEIGEICECLTKGAGDIAEEHADLLILLLGNCVALDIDIEKEFWLKYESIMMGEGKAVRRYISRMKEPVSYPQ
jgi:NTP pyrophosphatase (non-canonical NTP hydrolase)